MIAPLPDSFPIGPEKELIAFKVALNDIFQLVFVRKNGICRSLFNSLMRAAGKVN
jgi:hypothetical protein